PQSRAAQLRDDVGRIIRQVRADGDSTLRALTRRFDGCELAELAVSSAEFERAHAEIDDALLDAMRTAIECIERFHAAGVPQAYAVDTAPGVRCERIIRPIERVGLYVPAGTAPLPSTALMLGVPAR